MRYTSSLGWAHCLCIAVNSVEGPVELGIVSKAPGGRANKAFEDARGLSSSLAFNAVGCHDGEGAISVLGDGLDVALIPDIKNCSTVDNREILLTTSTKVPETC